MDAKALTAALDAADNVVSADRAAALDDSLIDTLDSAVKTARAALLSDAAEAPKKPYGYVLGGNYWTDDELTAKQVSVRTGSNYLPIYAAPVAPASAADDEIPGAETDLVLELAWLIDEGNCGPRSRAALRRAHAALKTVKAASADVGAPSLSRDAAQLTDWLLTDPQSGSKLRFAGPLERDLLGLSRVRMENERGEAWTLTAGLHEGYLTAAERMANIRAAAKEECVDASPSPIGYVEQTALEKLSDPQFANEAESNVSLWHAANPPSRAVVPIYAACVAPATAAPINLEGLRKKLLTPRKILRDENGWLSHPDYPICDEGTNADAFLSAFGIETWFRSMESDLPDFSERYHEEGLSNCSEWTPTAPAGEGWLLLGIYDTEDGPCAMFGRDQYEAENALKRQRMRELSARIQQRQADKGAAQ
ncbi:hypothetical protein [Paraburkholderia bannensis]|uniref:hypothetical protein n=1 Tax=Paraburkholderia bannensis TaxID=765414 RepID=UPI00069355FA|nr:hypothetical protein [Paraburkholderia bannensis]